MARFERSDPSLRPQAADGGQNKILAHQDASIRLDGYLVILRIAPEADGVVWIYGLRDRIRLFVLQPVRQVRAEIDSAGLDVAGVPKHSFFRSNAHRHRSGG